MTSPQWALIWIPSADTVVRHRIACSATSAMRLSAGGWSCWRGAQGGTPNACCGQTLGFVCARPKLADRLREVKTLVDDFIIVQILSRFPMVTMWNSWNGTNSRLFSRHPRGCGGGLCRSTKLKFRPDLSFHSLFPCRPRTFWAHGVYRAYPLSTLSSVTKRTAASGSARTDGRQYALWRRREPQEFAHDAQQQFPAVAHHQFAAKPFHVRMDRCWRDVQVLCHLQFGAIIEDPLHNLQFTPGKLQALGQFTPGFH